MTGAAINSNCWKGALFITMLKIIKYADDFLGAKLQDVAQQAHFLVLESGGQAAEVKEVWLGCALSVGAQ